MAAKHMQSLNVATIHSKPTTDVTKLIAFAPSGQHRTGLLVRKIFKQRLTAPLTTDVRGKNIFRINNTGNKQNPVTETQANALLAPGGTFHMYHH